MIFNLKIQSTLQHLLQQEDTDGDKKITIEDNGPKAFKLSATNGQDYIVQGTYFLSNLLQELVIAKYENKEVVSLSLSKIEEPPVERISRMIKDYYWNGLTRTIDKSGIEKLLNDTKNNSLTLAKLPIYIPFTDKVAFDYYQSLEETIPIKAIKLPAIITPEFVKSTNRNPGILSLKLEKIDNQIRGVPFVVPGGRFNEMYGWDSYFESIGLLLDDKVELAKAMADNFQYEINHYGKILNANRSYYLTRTQPPFYTSLIRDVFEKTNDIRWLQSHLKTAINEYETVWMVQGKRLTENGLNRYLAEGLGIPPEVEEGHYDALLKPFADQENCTIEEYTIDYQNNSIENQFLDTYFLHDRSVRESGHDTSYRIEGNCADLNLVELNALLYKYETDFGELISEFFQNKFECNSKLYDSEYWFEKASIRKNRIIEFCWNPEKELFFDYNHVLKTQSTFISATTLIPLWSKVATKEQAIKLVKKALPLLKAKGGITGSTAESSGEISNTRPHRQWDYPNGWAPHQMMIWKGLLNYGFVDEAQELVYRWLYMITKNAVDYNGTIPEKYDVVEATHKVFSEYGNVGTDFEYISQEGFGWMNASYQYGISLLKDKFKHHLNNLENPKKLF